jgi:hypothetical protein
VVRRLPSDLMREIESAGKSRSAEAPRQTGAKEPSGVHGLPTDRPRNSTAPIPRPPVGARRAPRSGPPAPARAQIASQSAVVEPSMFDGSDGDHGSGDKTLVVPGIGGAVLERARQEAAERQRQREPLYGEVPERTAEATVEAAPPLDDRTARRVEPPNVRIDETDMADMDDDMHGQRTVALAAPDIGDRLQKVREGRAKGPSGDGPQSWVVYALAVAAVLGVGSYFLIRFLF